MRDPVSDFLLYASRLDPGAQGAMTDRDAIAGALQAEACAWVHLQADDPRSDDWIEHHMGYLPEAVQDALIAEATRPRLAALGEGLLLNVRGVNQDEGEDPEDMVSVRIWADASRVVTLSRRPVAAIEAMRARYEAGRGPATAGTFLAVLVEDMTVRIGHVVNEIDIRADDLEERLLRGRDEGLRPQVNDARAAVVDFRRFLVPQREAVSRLVGAGKLLSENDVLELQEAEDNLRRAVEVLDSLRERLVVLKDELAAQADQRLNRNLYWLSVISAVFLPLGFLTGLMGINLAGMPGAEWQPAFWTFALLCAAIVVVQLGLLWLVGMLGRRPRQGGPR